MRTKSLQQKPASSRPRTAIHVLQRLALSLAVLPLAPAIAKAQSQPSNFDPRPLTSDEVAQFLPQICQGAQAAPGGYSCQAMTAYPGYESTPAAGTTYNIAPTSIIYGHLTDATSSQAYISYTADFEPHADNFGGGILFQRGADGWQLVRWIPGIILDTCLQLQPSGKAGLLCSFVYVGQGEEDSSLTLVTVPTETSANNDYSAFLHHILSGQDLRQTGDDNMSCGQIKSPDQYLLAAIDGLKRSAAPGIFATAKIQYIAPAAVTKFCAGHNLAAAPIEIGTLTITWQNGKITFTPTHNYAPPV